MNNRHPSEDPALGAIFKQFDPVKLTHDVITLGEEWADKDAAASALEETKKTTLASIQLEYMDASRSSAGSPNSGEQAHRLCFRPRRCRPWRPEPGRERNGRRR